MPVSAFLRAAPYCRLSKDDEQISESTSIETQRLMLGKRQANGSQSVQITLVDKRKQKRNSLFPWEWY